MKIQRLLLVLPFVLSFSPSLAADWLVTPDGTRIETQGEWKLDGKRIVFTDAEGRLASMRLSDVDVEASRRATLEAAETPTEAEAEAPRKALVKLTDADVANAGERRDPEAEQPIIFYSTSWCGWCRKTRSLLTELAVPYIEKDIEKDAPGRREYESKVGAGAGVPVLDFKGQVVRGYDERTIRRWASQLSAEREG